MKQPGQQIGGTERQQIAVGGHTVAVLERVRTDRTIRLGIQNHHQRKPHLPQPQPVGERQHRQVRHLQAEVDQANQLHTVGRQVQPLPGHDANDDDQQTAGHPWET